MLSQDLIWAADLALVLGMSLAGFLAMGLDKSIAKKNEKRVQAGKRPRRRIPRLPGAMAFITCGTDVCAFCPEKFE